MELLKEGFAWWLSGVGCAVVVVPGSGCLGISFLLGLVECSYYCFMWHPARHRIDAFVALLSVFFVGGWVVLYSIYPGGERQDLCVCLSFLAWLLIQGLSFYLLSLWLTD
jgi:hypothetical protein